MTIVTGVSVGLYCDIVVVCVVSSSPHPVRRTFARSAGDYNDTPLRWLVLAHGCV